MTEIVLIRHAESQANLEGTWSGQADGPLSDAGEASLDAIGKRLHERGFDVIVSSPLQRARRTAAAFTSEYEVWDNLVELDIGRWEGLSRDQVLSDHGDYLRKAITERTLPMGETGESLSDLHRRATGAIDALASDLPVLVDAGGLDLVRGRRAAPTLLTPHAGELARLLSRLEDGEVTREQVSADPLGHARRAADLTGATVLLKGATTLVVPPTESGVPVRSQRELWARCAAAGACSWERCSPSPP